MGPIVPDPWVTLTARKPHLPLVWHRGISRKRLLGLPELLSELDMAGVFPSMSVVGDEPRQS